MGEKEKNLFESMKSYLIQENQLTESEIEELENNCYKPVKIPKKINSALDYYCSNFGLGSIRDDGMFVPDAEDMIRYQRLSNEVSIISSSREPCNLSELLSNLESNYINNPKQDKRKTDIGKKALDFILEHIEDESIKSKILALDYKGNYA